MMERMCATKASGREFNAGKRENVQSVIVRSEERKSEGMEGAKSQDRKEAPEQICTQSRRSILRELEWNR